MEERELVYLTQSECHLEEFNEISIFGLDSLDIEQHENKYKLHSEKPFTLSRFGQRLYVNYDVQYECRIVSHSEKYPGVEVVRCQTATKDEIVCHIRNNYAETTDVISPQDATPLEIQLLEHECMRLRFKSQTYCRSCSKCSPTQAEEEYKRDNALVALHFIAGHREAMRKAHEKRDGYENKMVDSGPSLFNWTIESSSKIAFINIRPDAFRLTLTNFILSEWHGQMGPYYPTFRLHSMERLSMTKLGNTGMEFDVKILHPTKIGRASTKGDIQWGDSSRKKTYRAIHLQNGHVLKLALDDIVKDVVYTK